MSRLARFTAATLSVAHMVSRASAGVFVSMLVTAVCVASAAAATPGATATPHTTPVPRATAPSAPPTDTARLSLSTDGMHFSGNPGPLFAHPRLVPGRPVTADLWIRNASPDPTDLTIRLAAPGLDGSSALTLTVGATGETARNPRPGAILLPSTRLGPRATVRIPITVEIPAGTTERTGVFDFALTVTLGQATTTIPARPDRPRPDEPGPGQPASDPLPNTGFAAVDHLLLAAILLIMGVALTRSASHRRPIDRTDRP